jgi:hypothetical protein
MKLVGRGEEEEITSTMKTILQITCFQNVFSITSSKFSPVRSEVLFTHALNKHPLRGTK